MKLHAETRIFASFSLVGAVFAILAIALNGLAIDSLGIDPAAASATVLSILFILKYVCFRWLGLVVAKFVRYAIGNLIVTALSTAAIATMVESGGFSGSIATMSVIGLSFAVRYAVLRRLGVIRLKAAECAPYGDTRQTMHGDRK